MPAAVETMFSVNEVPWHGLGTILDSPPTPADAIRVAGLDWEVRLKPLYAHPDKEDAFVWAEPKKVQAFATTRATDGKVLGIVGPHYTVVQNAEAFSFFQPFIDSGTCKLETAGSLRGGRRIWVLARIEEDPTEILKGDEIRRYALMSNSHDGTLAVRVGFTGVRAVCENTLTWAHSEGKILRIRHSKNVHDALDAVQGIMDVANSQFAATVEQMRAMVRKGVVDVDVAKFVREVFKPKVFLTKGEEERYWEEGAPQLVGKVLPLFAEENERMPAAEGTVWTMYNSVTNLLTHHRVADQSRRLDSQWFGDSADKSRRALQVAGKLAMMA
jgi:phage/plasmid-like protein (TIGR03299 family)